MEDFSRFASSWWDKNSSMRMLHRFNDIRFDYIKNEITRKFPGIEYPNIKVLDFGCGGGILTESLHDIGLNVYGVDIAQENIECAKSRNCAILYYTSDVFFAQDEEKFKIIILSEVLEHVDDIPNLISKLMQYCDENAIFILSTINRTIKSLAFAKIAAEYILRIIPVGVHSWSKFIKPSEIQAYFEEHGYFVSKIKGIHYNVFTQSFTYSYNVDINYILTLEYR